MFSLIFDTKLLTKIDKFFDRHLLKIITLVLSFVSVYFFFYYLNNGLGLAYNDARSHLDIGRRVVEGLKPGVAQLGSVWLPLNHVLMIPLIWNDWAWHSGFAGAVWSMLSYVGTGILIYKYLEKLKVNKWISLFAVFIFASNNNILYLQSTAMTELLLLFTMTAGCYYLLLWLYDDNLIDLVKASFWVMMSTLVRYDGWFLLGVSTLTVVYHTLRKKGYKTTEGTFFFYCTVAGLGVVLWFAWNLLIFKDPFYFMLGPFSAHAQQTQLLEAGNLPTKSNPLLSTQIYFYALLFNSIATTAVLGLIASVAMWFDKKLPGEAKLASLSLHAPLAFNILALILGFSVLFVQGISGDTWFNVRYGIMVMPSLAIFIGYLANKYKDFKWIIVGLTLLVAVFAYIGKDAVVIDDARVGSSQKNVTEVSGWLYENARDKDGFVLISAASHDAIIFSSNLPMKKFIHEGTGDYWTSATIAPDRWARWIVMRTNDVNDLTFREIKDAPGMIKYSLIRSFPFADIYQLKEEYVHDLNTQPIYSKQR
jgi:hypothetical protein